MGDYERFCQLCGVSFNISRLRTATEPRTAAWARQGDLTNPTYVGAQHDLGPVPLCPRGTGCVIMYRGKLNLRDWQACLEGGAENTSYDENLRGHQAGAPDSSSAGRFLRFLERWYQIYHYYYPHKPASRLVLPFDGPPVRRNNQELREKSGGVLSADGEPAAENLSQYSVLEPVAVWEHISGPGCRNPSGYNGWSISVEEMKRCNTFQCLVRKRQFWHYERMDDDEEWEVNGVWFLTGLGDEMPDHCLQDAPVYPLRRLEASTSAQNIFRMDDENAPHNDSMPFHPTCFEAYKRAYLRRHDTFDVASLMSWWTLTDSLEKLERFPRDQDVFNGRARRWQHHPGAEYLAADPCVIPGLASIIKSCAWNENTPQNEQANLDPTQTVSPFGSNQQITLTSQQDIFDRLPIEILHFVLSHLTIYEAAMLKEAMRIRAFQCIPESYFERRILTDMPYLWELWSDVPYSRWLSTSVSEARGKTLLCCIMVTDDDEGDEEEEEEEEVREHAGTQDRITQPSYDSVNVKDLNIPLLVVRLEDAMKHGQLKGLRNRRRIWKDCEAILDEIDDMKRQGDITDDGKRWDEKVFWASGFMVHSVAESD